MMQVKRVWGKCGFVDAWYCTDTHAHEQTTIDQKPSPIPAAAAGAAAATRSSFPGLALLPVPPVADAHATSLLEQAHVLGPSLFGSRAPTLQRQLELQLQVQSPPPMTCATGPNSRDGPWLEVLGATGRGVPDLDDAVLRDVFN